MWWDRNYAYRIPDRYREHLGVKDAVNIYKMLLWVPLLGILLIILGVASSILDEPRMIYAETVIEAFEPSNQKDAITIQFVSGLFYDNTANNIFNYEVTSIDGDNVLVKIGDRTDTKSPWQVGVIVDIPIEKETRCISIEQRNGRKQLWLEKNQKTGKWEYAKATSKLKFFAKHYTKEFIVFLLINTGIITATIFTIKWAIKRSINKNSRNKNEEDEEYEE